MFSSAGLYCYVRPRSDASVCAVGVPSVCRDCVGSGCCEHSTTRVTRNIAGRIDAPGIANSQQLLAETGCTPAGTRVGHLQTWSVPDRWTHFLTMLVLLLPGRKFLCDSATNFPHLQRVLA